jgi:hypothetical protein
VRTSSNVEYEEPESRGRQVEHWTYKVLRRIAFTGLTVLFWAWLIILALSGKI